MYENIHVDVVFAKKMFIKAGCPPRLWKLWSEPTVSKWGCAEENVRLNLLPWEELMTTTWPHSAKRAEAWAQRVQNDEADGWSMESGVGCAVQ